MLMFKGASYFSLALGPSKLRTGPGVGEWRPMLVSPVMAGKVATAKRTRRRRSGGFARGPSMGMLQPVG